MLKKRLLLSLFIIIIITVLKKGVLLLQIFVEAVKHFILQDYLINRKFDRAFI